MTAYGHAFVNLLGAAISTALGTYLLTHNGLASVLLGLAVAFGIFALMWTIRGDHD